MPKLIQLERKFAFVYSLFATVERAFPAYNNMLREDRQNFNMETLRQYLYIYVTKILGKYFQLD